MFDEKVIKDEIILWIKNWFLKNGPDSKAVIGISGGKDSSIVAALCANALGKDRVYGVLMPNGEQFDIDVAISLCEFLDIKYSIINIKDAYSGVVNEIKKANITISDQALTNLPVRIRMSTLYAVSQSLNGRVANTCNLSEDYVGYSTKYGDMAGDFSPLSNLTVNEVKKIGRALGLPSKFVDKTPIDGLCGKTDEDNLGFTYDVLDRYIRENVCEDKKIKERIDELHNKNLFKLLPMDSYKPNI